MTSTSMRPLGRYATSIMPQVEDGHWLSVANTLLQVFISSRSCADCVASASVCWRAPAI